MRKFLLAAVVAAAVLIGSGSSANAAYQVRFIEDGGTVYNDINHGGTIGVIILGNSLTFAGTTTFFSVANGSALSNNPGTQGGANLNMSGSGGQVTTTFGASGGHHTLQIIISQDGWNRPVGTPLTLSASGGGSIAFVAADPPAPGTMTVAASFNGFLDNTNALLGMPVAGMTPTQNASASLSNTGTAPLVYTPGTSVNPSVPGGVPFSMTSSILYDVTLTGAGGQHSFNSSFNLTAAVPAPAGVVLALTGLPVLGIGGWIRRRRQAVQV